MIFRKMVFISINHEWLISRYIKNLAQPLVLLWIPTKLDLVSMVYQFVFNYTVPKWKTRLGCGLYLQHSLITKIEIILVLKRKTLKIRHKRKVTLEHVLSILISVMALNLNTPHQKNILQVANKIRIMLHQRLAEINVKTCTTSACVTSFDLMLTNKPINFYNTSAVTTALSDCH